jgi:hypothetical protein
MNSNKLIAEYMGLENPFNEITDATLYKYKGVDEKGEYQFNIELHEMRYDKSWDWLMPVVRKIEQRNELIGAHILSSDIDATYQAVIKFIQR